MKYSRSPSLERYVIGRDSVLTFSSFSPARKVFSTTAPLSMFLSRVLTNAPPLPGLTCWKNRIVNRLPSTRMAVPFLNWLVDIMLDSSPSRRPTFAAVPRGVNPAQTPRYYRTVSLPVSRTPHRDRSAEGKVLVPTGERRSGTPFENVADRGDIAIGSHAGDQRVHGRRDHRHLTPLLPGIYIG